MKQTDGLMTIGQAARAVGVATHTLRYYEQERILAPTVRSRAGYRLYDHGAVEQLQFIRSAQAVGFTLDDIRTLLGLGLGSNETCRSEVHRMLTERLAGVDQKMKDLRRVQAALKRALNRCRRSDGECAVLNDLRPKKKRRRRE